MGGVGIEPDRALEGPGVYGARRHLDWSRPQAVCRMCFMIDLQKRRRPPQVPLGGLHVEQKRSYMLAALGTLLGPEFWA